MTSRIYFCTFADSSCMPSLKRIKRQARKMGVFEDIYVFTEKNIPNYAIKRVQDIINITGTKRGYGYWSWKPALIKDALLRINDNDVLLYCDAGCNLNVKGKEKLSFYIEKAIENDIVATRLLSQYTDYAWTKMDTIEHFKDKIVYNGNKDPLEAAQLQGGTIFLKKNSYTLGLIDEWDKLMNIENIHYYDDTPSITPNHPTFHENRHDQSLFSLLLKSYHYYAISEENFHSYNEDGWKELWEKEPILQSRDLIKSIWYVSGWRRRLSRNKFLSYCYRKLKNINDDI